MKNTFVLLLVCLSFLLVSCDDGRLFESEFNYTEKGRVAKLDADITGMSSLSNNYTIAFAGFTEDGTYSEISKVVQPDANGHVSMVLAGIPDDVTKLEVCIINSIRKRVATFYAVDAPSTSDTIMVVPDAAISVSMFDYLQNNVFDKQCSHCHSGSSWAASLNLNPGKSYINLVGVASHMVEGKNRVSVGDADNSVLYDVLATDLSSGWKYDHSKIMVTDAANLQLIKDWINSGAKE